MGISSSSHPRGIPSLARELVPWRTARNGRPDAVWLVSLERSARDRHRRRGAGTDRPLRDRPALAGAPGGRANLDRRARDETGLAVRDDLLARLQPLGDDRVVALVPRHDDGA